MLACCTADAVRCFTRSTSSLAHFTVLANSIIADQFCGPASIPSTIVLGVVGLPTGSAAKDCMLRIIDLCVSPPILELFATGLPFGLLLGSFLLSISWREVLEAPMKRVTLSLVNRSIGGTRGSTRAVSYETVTRWTFPMSSVFSQKPRLAPDWAPHRENRVDYYRIQLFPTLTWPSQVRHKLMQCF